MSTSRALAAHSREPHGPSAHEALAARTAAAFIVVIEDNDDFRATFAQLLGAAGYGVSAYASAAAALKAMEGGAVPDLILLDLMMPGMNGWQFRIAQKQRPELCAIPVVALSADTSPYAGAIDAQAYVKKPVEFERLAVVLGQVLAASRRAQEAATEAAEERMQHLACLVASVSHEVNNPLTYLLANLDLAGASIDAIASGPGADRLEECLDKLERGVLGARSGTLRIASYVRLLGTFVPSGAAGVRAVDVLHPIDAALRLAHLLIRERAELVCEFAPVPLVAMDEASLAQVILTLLANAAQAIPSGDPRRSQVRVRTHTEHGCAVIAVEDTGVGIQPELLHRVFEPHFSTKPTRQGLGVGLARARDMIVASGGALTVRSVPGKGSSFRVTLPSYQLIGPVHVPKAPVQASAPATPLRVLVIDDEPMIGDLVAAALLGHSVRTSDDPSQALCEIADRSYDVVLCDLMMPELGGIEFYTELCKRRPDLRGAFVLMTGAVLSPELEAFLANNQVPLIRKPFAMRDLCTYIAERASHVAS